MTVISRSAIVPYTTMQMFQLVDKVEDYPHFLPWCHASEVTFRNDNEVKATLILLKGGIRKSFATHNFTQSGKMIEIRLLSGPFRHLHGFWRFDPLSDTHSKIALDLEFEFSSKLISLALNPIFNQIGDTLVDAFHQRAKTIYGN